MNHYRNFSCFAGNRAHWERLDSVGAAQLATASFTPVAVEALPPSALEQWRELLPLKQGDFLIIYGVGVGEPYLALKGWLAEKEGRTLILIESDPSLLTAFLSTSTATEMLTDSRAWLYYVPTVQEQYKVLAFLSSAYPFANVELAPFPTQIQRRHPLHWQAFCTNARICWSANVAAAEEMRQRAAGFLCQLYQNLFELPHSRNGSDLKDRFRGIPAIICGAGPSLGKNRHLLHGLRDRALILSGGTAVNALNAGNLHPHLAVGIDPNRFFYNRILTTTSWHVPFLYYYRMFHPALAHVHGDKLLLNLKGDITLPEWFHQHLDVCAPVAIDAHLHNVINFCTVIAIELGCNPLIFIGLDLAYSDDAAYAAGLTAAATHQSGVDFRTKHDSEEILIRNDIHGKPVRTLWKWIVESIWYGQLSKRHSHLTLVNATEGGLGFPTIPNLTLADAAERYLTHSWDLDGRVHTTVQRCRPCLPPSTGTSAITEALAALDESVVRCLDILTDASTTLASASLPLETRYQHPAFPIREHLHGEPAFDHILSRFDYYHLRPFTQQFLRLDADAGTLDPTVYGNAKRQLHLRRYTHYIETLHEQHHFITPLLAYYRKHSTPLTKEPETFIPTIETTEPPLYLCDGGCVTIYDPHLNLDLRDSSLRLLEQRTTCDDDGKLICDAYYTSDGLLHGPANGYGVDGNCISQTWYFTGQRQGLTHYWWHDGAPYAILPYRHGQLDGTARYLYPDGRLRALIPYQSGTLNGTVLLYYPNGNLHRRSSYLNGKRHGPEEVWQDNGLPILDAHYLDDKPTGTARQWHLNGALARHRTYDDASQPLSEEAWDDRGNPTSLHLTDDDRYLASIREQLTQLHASLQTVADNFTTVASALNQSNDLSTTDTILKDYQDDLQHVQLHLSQVSELQQFIDKAQASHTTDTEEPLWRTPTFMQHIEEKRNALTAALQHDLSRWIQCLRTQH